MSQTTPRHASNCPHCGGSVGYLNVLVVPPTRPFSCESCSGRVTTDSERGVAYVGVIFVAFAGVWILFGLPDNLKIWHFLGGGLLAVLPYPLFAKVEAA